MIPFVKIEVQNMDNFPQKARFYWHVTTLATGSCYFSYSFAKEITFYG